MVCGIFTAFGIRTVTFLHINIIVFGQHIETEKSKYMSNETYNVLVNDIPVASEILSYDYAKGICRGINLTYENEKYIQNIRVELEIVNWDTSINLDEPIKSERKVML